MREENSVKVLDVDGHVVGAGVLALGNKVLTVAHVVNAALGRDRLSSQIPGPAESVTIQIPADHDKEYKAQVAVWLPPAPGTSTGDFALLELDYVPQHNAPVTRLNLSSGWKNGTKIIVHGYPSSAGYPTGSPVNAEVRGASRHYVEFSISDAQVTIESGFSGSGVWIDDDELVGLVESFDANRGRGMYLRCAQISQGMGSSLLGHVYPFPSMDRQWNILRWLRCDALHSLLEDLDAAQTDGIRPEECQTIRVQLGTLATVFGDLEEITAVSDKPTYRKVEDLQSAYVKWNDCKTPSDRFNALRGLRSKRRMLAKDLKTKGFALSHEDAADQVNKIVDAMQHITKAHGGTFVQLQTALWRLGEDPAA